MTPAPLVIRDATASDLPALVSMLADDPLGSQRETTQAADLAAYERALAEIEADPSHCILVAEHSGVVAAMLQLSYIPHLTYTGGRRAQIEGVRVASELRARGIGRRLIEEAIDRARARGCHLVQLSTDRRRPEALGFYEQLGFEATHVGLKLHLGAGGR